MKFEDAFVYFRKGRKIKSPLWNEGYFICQGDENHKSISIKWIDLIQEGWEVIEEPGKTFPEVFEAFKSLKRIRRKKWSNNEYIEWNDSSISINDILANDWEIID